MTKETSKLLKQGAKPSITDSKGQTPLHLAAANGNAETVTVLLKHKISLWYAENNTTPLHLAAKNGHTAIVRKITTKLDRSWSTERSRDLQAIEIIKSSMDDKFNEKFGTFFREKTFTARELAVIYGHIDAAFSLPSTKNDDIGDAFSVACMLGDAHVAEEIWNYHESRGYFNRHSSLMGRFQWFPALPLHLAVMSGSRATVRFLLERGCNANAKSLWSISGIFMRPLPPYSSPAHYAAMTGSTEILQALKRRGANADLTALDHQSRTPLSYAVESLHEPAVQLLIDQSYSKGGPILGGFCNPYLGDCASQIYLGCGHEWPDSSRKLAAIPSMSIRKALKSVGLKG